MARKPKTPPSDPALADLPDDELEKLAWQEFEAEVDDYVKQFEDEMRAAERKSRKS